MNNRRPENPMQKQGQQKGSQVQQGGKQQQVGSKTSSSFQQQAAPTSTKSPEKKHNTQGYRAEKGNTEDVE